ncbi:MAG: ATP-dependent Clp protease proteolytic subunit [Flavobacteriales bacterium]
MAKLISFWEGGREVGRLEAAASESIARFSLVGRIYEWTAGAESQLRGAIEKTLTDGIKKARLYLSSEGGSVFATYEIANLLDRFDDVKIEVGALMLSAATYLTSRFHTTVKKNTQGMIHMPTTTVSGNAKELESDLKLLYNITANYLEAYADKTGKTTEEIKNLWKDGDHWMDAAALEKEGFVDAVATAPAPFGERDIKALVACGSPYASRFKSVAKMQTQNEGKMDREKLIALYGLEADASDEEILQAARKAKVEALKYKEAETRRKAGESAEQAKRATELVETAIKDKRIGADRRGVYEKLAAADYKSTKTALEALTPVPQLTKALKSSKAGLATDRGAWSLDDYLDNDPEAYEELKVESPQQAKALEDAYFNKK